MSRKIKRIIAVFMTIVLLFGVTSCNKQSSGNSGESTKQEEMASSKPNNSSDSNNESTSLDTTSEKSDTVLKRKKRIKVVKVNNEEQKVSALVGKKLSGIAAENTILLSKNPDRGFRLEIHLYLNQVASRYNWKNPSDIEGMVNAAYEQIMYTKRKYVDEQNAESDFSVSLAYVWMEEYKNTGLDDAAVAAVDAILAAFRKAKIKVRLNCNYQPNMEVAGAPENIMLSDIKKLGPIIEKNKDVIYALQVCFYGAFGEWHSDLLGVDKTKVIKAIADICPKDIYMLARLPEYKNLLKGIPEYESAYNRIGFSDDAFFGAVEKPGSGQNKIYPGTEAWQQWTEQGPYTPNDGEAYVSSFFEQQPSYYFDPWLAIEAMSKHYFTTFSFYHAYLDSASDENTLAFEETLLSTWKKVNVTSEELKKKGYSFSPNWFKDSSGKTVSRNAFEYIRDHLGYYLEAQSIKVTGTSAKGETVNITMPLKNYGFSAAFNLKSGFAILDSEGKVVSEVNAGTPSSWHPTDPKNYEDTETLTYKITSSLKLPTESGDYSLAFFVKNKLGQYVHLANDIEYKNGYNILHNFSI